MPLMIIKQDITRLRCDAIVNPTNPNMNPDGGADEAIHTAAGPELLKYCNTLGGLSVGEAKITPAFNLPAKHVIHTVGPKWRGGFLGERVLLRSCYSECMQLAIDHGCKSIAFPLIASGLYGYPKDKVLKEATDVIRAFLEDCEMDVYVVLYDKTDYSIPREVLVGVQAYIDDFYSHESVDLSDACIFGPEHREERRRGRRSSFAKEKYIFSESAECCSSVDPCEIGMPSPDLHDMLKNMDKGFADTLFYYIDKKGLSDVEAYKRSNVGKKTFSKIKCNKDYRPSKITAVSFAIGLRLDIKETTHLLSTVGMCLSRADKFDVIIEYFIMTGKYDSIFDVNEVLYQFDQSLLGV